MKKFKFTTYLLVIALTMACSSDDSENSSNNDTLPPPTTSDLSLSKSVNNNSPFVGDTVTFSLLVNNLGPLDASGILVKDILPSGYTYVSDNGTSNTTYNENTGIWTLSDLTSGSNSTLNIQAIVNATGTYLNIAEIIASDTPDPDSTPNNNLSSEDDQDNAITNPITPSPVQVSTYAIVNAGDGLTIDDSGNLFAANYGASVVYKIDSNQTVSTFLNNQPGAAGMIFDDQGFMYLARYNSSEIVKISANANSINLYAENVAAPIAVDFDSEGNLYTNNNVNNAITKIDSNGMKTTISTAIYNNSSITLDDADNIYVSDYNSGTIMKIDAITNTESVFTNLPISGGVGFIIFSDGYFYATAISNDVIYKIDSAGNSEIIAGQLNVSGDTDGNGDVALFNKPNGIVASSDGMTLYVAQQGGSGAIRVITGFRED